MPTLAGVSVLVVIMVYLPLIRLIRSVYHTTGESDVLPSAYLLRAGALFFDSHTHRLLCVSW